MPTVTREYEAPDTAAKAARQLEAVEEATTDIVGEKLVLNMGPSHPATHGVLRLILELDGEIITKCDPDVGFLHRGDEKIAENMHYNQFVPYTDRLDYLAPLANNIPLCALAAILFVVAWNMSELPHFISMVKKAPKTDTAILLITFLLTVFTDLVVAVNIGVVLDSLTFM